MGMNKRFYQWAHQKTYWAVILLLLILGVVGYFSFQDDALEEVSEPLAPAVETTTPTEYAGGQTLSLIGNVRAFTEANVTTERSGRVTGVTVSLGESVQAGQIIATLENAAQQAAVLQAEGTYDAAQAALNQARAADAQSQVGVNESNTSLRSAQNTAVNAYQSAYTTVNGIVLNNVDTFFSTPNATIPGLRLNGYGNTSFLNSERVAYQSLLPEWQRNANALTVNDNLDSALNTAEANVERTLALLDTFIVLFNQQDNSRYSDAELQTFSTNFTNLRAQLNATQNNLESARTGLQNAADTGTRADIDTSVSAVPAAEAQVKQALGSLRAAQANLAQSILRTPISGTVNSLSVSTGDFLNSFATIAKIANNNALEIITYVSDRERDLVEIGDSILIEGQYEGRITQIAPAVDPDTRKIEMRVATENTQINNGDTVRLTKDVGSSTSRTVVVPITAVKFAVEDGSIFVVEEDRLVARPVTLGVVRGGSVEVLEGLAANEEFVIDARGLQAGENVTVSE